MPARRSSTSIRGTRTPAARGRVRPSPQEFLPEQVAEPTRPRDVVSFALARRAALESLRRGILSFDHCDADPGLLRAGKYHGEPTGHDCPVCRREELVEVSWVFGAQLGALNGSARSRGQLAAMAFEYGSFRVHVVELCRRCSWNHLVMSFTLGDGHPRNRPSGTPGADA